MSNRKQPNPDISRTDLMKAESLSRYLYFKKEQLGLSVSQIATTLGYSGLNKINHILQNSHQAKGFSAEQVEQLIEFFEQKHEELGLETYDFDELTRFKRLNDDMPKPRAFKGIKKGRELAPDPSITEETLLEAQTFAEYLEQKRLQLGITKKKMGEVINGSPSLMNQIGMRKCGFSPEDIARFESFMEEKSQSAGIKPMSDRESAHMHALHDGLEPFTETRGPTSKNKPDPKTPSYDPRVKLTRYAEFDEKKHILPTEDMLKALTNKEAQEWNRIKADLLKKNPRHTLFLRGFDASRMELNDYDLSQCDLIGFQWPKNVRYTVPKSLEGSQLIAPGKGAENAYYALPINLRRAFEKENPRFNIHDIEAIPAQAGVQSGITPLRVPKQPESGQKPPSAQERKPSEERRSVSLAPTLLKDPKPSTTVTPAPKAHNPVDKKVLPDRILPSEKEWAKCPLPKTSRRDTHPSLGALVRHALNAVDKNFVEMSEAVGKSPAEMQEMLSEGIKESKELQKMLDFLEVSDDSAIEIISSNALTNQKKYNQTPTR